MNIQRAVADQEEYSWSNGGSYVLKGWKIAEGKVEFHVSDRQGQEIQADLSVFPRPDVAAAYPEAKGQEQELGFSVTIHGLEAIREKQSGLQIDLVSGTERYVLVQKTAENLEKEYLEASIRYHMDEVALKGEDIYIRGWILDESGENSLEITDECGKVQEGLSRVMRRDVTDYLHLETETPIGFVFSMPRKEFHGEKLVLQMKNQYTSRTHEISMKTFDFENSRRGKLQKALSREKLPQNKEVLKTRGIRGFVEYVREEIRDEDERYMAWLKKHQASSKELRRQRKRKFSYEPLISIVIPLYNTPQEYLRELLESIKAQTYRNFELCLADGSTIKGPGEFVKKFYGKDQRIRYKHIKNDGIAGNTNEAIRMAKGEFLLFADHDDLLEPDALFELVKALNEKQDLDILYTDEDLTDARSERFSSPRFKPDYNPDFLCSINYICHIFMVRRSLALEAGLLRKECDGAQDHDFILRCTEKTDRIHHIPKILYHWRAHEGSTAGNQDSKLYAIENGKRALREHYARLGYEAQVEYTGIFIMYHTLLKVKGEPLVSILIPNKDQADTLKNCLESIFKKTDYPNYEIVIIENNSTEPETFAYYEEVQKEHSNVRVITYTGEFNYSAINNEGVREAKGEYLLFLNNDIEVISPYWIREMLGFCQRKDTAIVGAKLYYPDDTVQHAGVVVGLCNFAGHILMHHTRHDNGYFGKLKATQDISAVTAACLLMKRSVFEEVHGFDEAFVVSLNDVDLCLKAREAGYLVVMDPNVELYHYESKSRGYENTPEKQERFRKEIARFQERWSDILEKGDPYYNPNMTLIDGECGLKKEGEGEYLCSLNY